MLLITRLKVALWPCLGAGLLLAGCQAAPTAAPAATPVVVAPATQAATVASPPSTATPTPTTVTPPGSPTAAPSASATLSPSPLPSPSPSASSSPTAASTATSSPTAGRPTAAPTRPPFVTTPLGPPAQAPLYSTTTGPDGYSSRILCQRPSAPCAPVMPPGDISFQLGLSSDAAAPWTHFVYYGLSVEKDGANVASLFMFVDAGWLQPGAVVGFGASRNFSQTGRYVIRSSGCITTDTKSTGCGWATLAGDVVTFSIQ